MWFLVIGKFKHNLSIGNTIAVIFNKKVTRCSKRCDLAAQYPAIIRLLFTDIWQCAFFLLPLQPETLILPMDCNRLFDCLFETSWEVCNKIGGIYTVLSTKAKTLQGLYKDKAIFVGPDVWTEDNPSPYFVESAVVLRNWRKQAVLPEGVTVRTGRWNIPGRPMVVLVKFDAMYACKDALYGRMWEHFGVDSLHAYGDYDEACAFSHAAALVIESISHYLYRTVSATARIIAHFDEWTTGMGLLYVKDRLPQVATVFTTHATSIGHLRQRQAAV